MDCSPTFQGTTITHGFGETFLALNLRGTLVEPTITWIRTNALLVVSITLFAYNFCALPWLQLLLVPYYSFASCSTHFRLRGKFLLVKVLIRKNTNKLRLDMSGYVICYRFEGKMIDNNSPAKKMDVVYCRLHCGKWHFIRPKLTWLITWLSRRDTCLLAASCM